MTVPREYDPSQPATTQAASTEMFGTDIQKIAEAANALLLGRTQRSTDIGAGIATVGPGENINTAIQMVKSAGGGTVVLKPGNYVLNADILVPGGVTLEGASRDNCVINCNTSYGIQIAGSDEYTTGTIAATNGDATITGTGTTWTAAMVGRYILVDGFWYLIASFTSTTSLEISEAFGGTTFTGGNYAIATVNSNATLRRLTIHNSSGSGVIVRSAIEPKLDDLYIYECGTGIDMDYVLYPLILVTSNLNGTGANMFQCHGYKVDFSAFEYNTGNGITMEECGDASFFDTSVNSNGGVGISFTDCYDTAFVANAVKENTSHGIELVANNRDMQFIGVTADGNGGDGYKLTATSDRITMSSSTIINNGGYGISIAASTCDDNYIIAPSFSGNASGEINDDGTNTTVISNEGTNGATLRTFQPINGSATPQAVMIESDGTALLADANDTDIDEFIGFIKADYSAQTPGAYLGSTESTGATTFSHTLQAGTDRVVVVFIAAQVSSGSVTAPSGVTWNGNAMTQQGSTQDAALNQMTVWRYAAGTGIEVTGNVVVTGLSGTGLVYDIVALNYQYIDQSTVVLDSDVTNDTASGGDVPNTLSPQQAYGIAVGAAMNSGNVQTLDSAFSTRQDHTAPRCAFGDVVYIGTDNISYSHDITGGSSTGTNRIGIVLELKNSVSTEVKVVVGGKIKGFSGLTPGANYYLSNTAGAISTTPGATSIKVGKALSATEIVIIQT